MLCISRRTGEAICIGGTLIRIVVLTIRPGVVRIGIDAPKDISVNREEIEVMKRQAIQRIEEEHHDI